jgi:hypothetical protein
MKILTNVLMIVGAISILLAALVGVGAVLYSLSPPLKAKMVVTPVSAEASTSFDKKVNAFIKDIETFATSGKESEVTLTISEQEANSKIISVLAEGKLPIKEMLVNFKEDICWAYGLFDNAGITAKIGLVAQIKIIEGKFKIIPSDFQLGSLPLPTSFNENFGSLLDITIRMQGIGEGLPMKITSIKIGNGQLTVKGMTRPLK